MKVEKEMTIEIATLIATLIIALGGFWWNFRMNFKHKMFLEKLRTYNEFISCVAEMEMLLTEMWKIENDEELKQKEKKWKKKIKKNKELQSKVQEKLLILKQQLILFAPTEILEYLSEIGSLRFMPLDQTKDEMDRILEKVNKFFELLILIRKDLKLSGKKISIDVVKKLI